MKKVILNILIIIGFFSLCINVKAEEYQLNSLIPIDSFATVKTEKFNYIDFIYDSSGNAKIVFGAITNNTSVKNPVSINILLFDGEQKNIGFLTYCSDKDISSDYAGFKLSGGQSSAFKIDVTKRYFVDGYNSSNVKYIAVMDENKYCHIGGYDNYKGLTISEIIESNSVGINEKQSIFSKFKFNFNFNLDNKIIFIILYSLIALAVFILYASIINALNKKMYYRGTILAYIPIINVFVAVKLAFGKIITLIYIVLYLISGFLYLKVSILLYIVSGFSVLALIIDIIKLITKKYDLFYFEPTIKSAITTKNNTTNVDNSAMNEQILDLSYNDEGENVEEQKDDSVSNDLFNVSSSEIQDLNNSSSDSGNNSNNSSDDISDLSKFF